MDYKHFDQNTTPRDENPDTASKPKSTSSDYFAAKEPAETARILIGKAQSFFNVLRANAYLEKLAQMWRAYHGAYGDYIGFGHRINFTGEQGELVSLPVNHFRNIAQHIINMVSSNRPVMEARAINTDYKSLAQTYLANGILDYYMREKHLELALKKALELAVVMGAGFIKLEWNATAGETYDFDEETQQFNYEGEIEFSTLSPFDVVVDGTKESWNNEWILTKTFQNRYNLMAKYPELADQIKAIPTKTDGNVYRLAVFSNDDTDDVPVYEFFHKKTESMPDGRYLLFLDDETVMLDIPLPYRVIPIFRIAAGEILGTPYGYTNMFDIFPIQEGLNSTYSAIMTNQNAFAVQNLWVERGADINVNSLDGAMNIIEGNKKPEPLNLTQTPPEVFNFLNTLIQAAETISGVNSVARGNPEASLKSGNALALVQSMALQFISGLQQSYVGLVEQVGTALIQILKDFATTPKVVALVGRNNRPLLKEFTGEQINAINRVVVDMGNPLSRCLKRDTPILMFDGTIKMVQDVSIGDLVMGPDSKQRTVTNTNSDQEMMYDVVSKDKHQKVYYGCNESHIISLKYCSADGRHGLKQYQVVDMSVKEYLSLPKRHQRLFMGFKTGVEFDKKIVTIPPYILGSWLGDGNSRNTAITTMDPEIEMAWRDYADSLGLHIRVVDQEDNKSKLYYITSGEMNGRTDRNSFMNRLREYDLIQNKHIPHSYLTSSREDRLELLAGFLDTDGTLVSGCTFVASQKDQRVTDGIIYLARSLGFRVTCIKRLSDSGPSRDGRERTICGEYNSISIGGNTWEIPTKLPRKQAINRRPSRNWLNYGIEVKPVGIGTFYGFTLKEEPHFVLGDFTVTHNTIAGRVQMAEQLAQMHLLDNPHQYFQVLNTGRLDSTFEGEMQELMLIKQENEAMLDGQNVQATVLDSHRMHIMEHKSVLADPELRKDSALVEQALTHIQDHINLLRNTDPDLLGLIGEQPLPPPGAPPQGLPPMPPPGAQQGPPQGGPRPPKPKGPGGGHPQLPAHQTGPQGGRPPTGNPPSHSIQGNVIPKQMQPQGQAGPGQHITNEAIGNTVIPQLPRPPSPFQNLPINPADLIAT